LVGFQGRQSTFFVNPHKPAITSDISREDGGQAPFDPRFGH
jgi:hypothetical protein